MEDGNGADVNCLEAGPAGKDQGRHERNSPRPGASKPKKILHYHFN